MDHLIKPHGGELKELIVDSSRSELIENYLGGDPLATTDFERAAFRYHSTHTLQPWRLENSLNCGPTRVVHQQKFEAVQDHFVTLADNPVLATNKIVPGKLQPVAH